MPNNNVIAVEALSCVAEVVVAGMFESEVVFVVLVEGIFLLDSGSSSSGSSWCFRLDLFLALPVFCFFISVFLPAVEAATDEVDNLPPF